MKSGSVLASCVILAVIFPGLVHLSVPPKTPVLSGFEPAAIGSNRELVCDASQPSAGTITYKWYKYSNDNGVENWESKGPIGTSQKYIFSPVTETKVFHTSLNKQPVSGKYMCQASNSAGTRDSEWGDLYVYKPCSSYSVSVSPAQPAIGSRFTLHCYIPNPSGFTARWLRKTDASSAAIDVAVANSKECHAPDNPRYSWSSCSPPSLSSPSRTFKLQVNNAQTSDSTYWMCKDIGLSCDSNPVKPIVQAMNSTTMIVLALTALLVQDTFADMPWDTQPAGSLCYRHSCGGRQDCCQGASLCGQTNTCFNCWRRMPCNVDSDCCLAYPVCTKRWDTDDDGCDR